MLPADEKMLNITNNQGKTNQNHNKISPHTCWNGYHQEDETTGAAEDMMKREPLYTLGGNVNFSNHYGK